MSLFLCYRIPKIQAYISQIPKLPYVVGSSSRVDLLDRKEAKKCSVTGATLLFSGAGKGAFECTDESAVEEVKEFLLLRARWIGASIAFGAGARYLTAAECRDQLYSFVVDSENLVGHPCRKSALIPVRDGQEHPMIGRRHGTRGGEDVWRYFERRFEPDAGPLLPALVEGKSLEFFRDVSPDGETIDEDEAESTALAAARALGSRNRWAVIVMDGDDLGAQFDVLDTLPPSVQVEWLQAANRAIDSATEAAVKAAIDIVIREWGAGIKVSDVTVGESVIVPIRPLIVGGDDIKVLCHVEYASTFVREVRRVFEDETKAANEKYRATHQADLWHASEGQLSISAGVLYANVSLPLSTAMAYAESLLGRAKSKRHEQKTRPTEPVGGYVDWESVTASVVDDPDASRTRNYRFRDRDIGEYLRLTRRPYSFDEFEALERHAAEHYAKIPATILHQVLPEMSKPYWDRALWRARIGKSQPALAADLAETERLESTQSRWKHEVTAGQTERTIDILDAIDLLIERTRMSRPTLGA